jgi:hypothetical protein
MKGKWLRLDDRNDMFSRDFISPAIYNGGSKEGDVKWLYTTSKEHMTNYFVIKIVT